MKFVNVFYPVRDNRSVENV